MENSSIVTYKALMNVYTKDKAELILKVKRNEMSKEEFKENIIEFMNVYYPNEVNKEEVAKTMLENLFGYSVLTSLIEEKDITDIKVHAWNRIIIKRKGQKSVSDITFENEAQYNRFIESVITRNQINASSRNAISRFTDDDSFEKFILRFTLVTPVLTTAKNYELIIRKIPKDFYSMDDLVDEEMMTEDVKEYLIKAWDKGSVLICGANSSGKTTMLNALKEEIPHDKSVLVIQQAEELTTRAEGGHPDMIFLHSLEGNSESDVHYDLKDLSIGGLTMDIEYFIIGEVKGAEASYLLNASYTGHIAGATVHASSSVTGIDKIVDYALYNSSYTKQELLAMMTSFKTVVFMKNFKVCEISEIIGVKDNKIEYKPIFRM